MPDTYRPRTTAGVYVPTATTVAPQWPGVKPFALTSASQFRPLAPIALKSVEWAANYNEIKELGGRNSTKRSARQTEDARFWLATDGRVFYPIVITLAAEKKFNLIDCARLLALTAVARAIHDRRVDAKYHYEFWRPITAIRNGDIDDIRPPSATRPGSRWKRRPCIRNTRVRIASKVPARWRGAGRTRHGGDCRSFDDQPDGTRPDPPLDQRARFYGRGSQARIWSGFHYRFSTKVGQDMGYKIGEYVVNNVMQPVKTATR